MLIMEHVTDLFHHQQLIQCDWGFDSQGFRALSVCPNAASAGIKDTTNTIYKPSGLAMWLRSNFTVTCCNPTIIYPPDQTFECGTSYSTDISVTGNAYVPNANCSSSVSISHSDVTTPSSCFSGTGTIARTFFATDSCGNNFTSTQHLNIVDTIPPSITTSSSCMFPPNNVIYCFPSSSLLLSFSDTCSSVTVSKGTVPSNTEGYYYDPASDQYCVAAILGSNYGISFTATDGCGNSATSTADIFVPSVNEYCGVFTSCDTSISATSISKAVFTTIDAYGYEYAPQYRAAVQIVVQEPVLQNWRLEVHLPVGDEIVRYSQYDIYTDGMFQCEVPTKELIVISPQSWAMSVTQGNTINVEYVATNNGRLTVDEIQAVTQFFVFIAS